MCSTVYIFVPKVMITKHFHELMLNKCPTDQIDSHSYDTYFSLKSRMRQDCIQLDTLHVYFDNRVHSYLPTPKIILKMTEIVKIQSRMQKTLAQFIVGLLADTMVILSMSSGEYSASASRGRIASLHQQNCRYFVIAHSGVLFYRCGADVHMWNKHYLQPSFRPT